MKEESKKITKSNDFEVSRVTKYLNEALDAWRSVQLNWFVYDSFYKGNHYLSIDRRDLTIKNVPDGATIPYIYHVVRLISNNSSKVAPKWTFIPNEGNPKAVDDAINIAFMMDKVFEDANISQLIRDGEKEALKFSACPFFVGWDEKNNKCLISLENPFYIIPDPRARTLQEAKYVIRIVETDFLSLKNNPKYNQDEVAKLQPEAKVAGTPIYERVITETNKVYPNISNQEAENYTVFVKEFYEKVEVEGVTKIKLTTTAQSSLLYQDITNLEDYPFEFLYSDKDPLSFYGEGWVKPLITINKMINHLETRKAQYIDKVSVARYRLQRGATIERKTVNGVEVTYYDPILRNAPEPEPIPPWPSAADSSAQTYNSYMRDFGGISDIMMGNVPSGVEAYKAIESLIEQSDNVTLEVKKNMLDFMKRLAKKVLWNYSTYLADPQSMQLNEMEPIMSPMMGPDGEPVLQPVTDSTGEKMERPREIQVIGENTPKGRDLKQSMIDSNGANYMDIVYLPSDMDIRVDTSSEMAYTESARREMVMQMVEMGILPKKQALEMLRVSNIKDVMIQFEEEEKKQMEMEAQKAEMNKADPPPVDDKPKISIGFKDLPPVSQVEYLQSVGLYPTAQDQQAQLMAQLQQMAMAQQPEQPAF